MPIYKLTQGNPMRSILLLLSASVIVPLIAAGCAHTTATVGEPIERGWINRSVLEGPPHEVFKVGYDTARVQEPIVAMLRSVDAGIKTIVFLGTWCPDSRRNVPHFLKVADEAGIPADSISLYCVDRTKKSDDGLTSTYQIERVPTFIFLKGGKEIGRIVESPELSIEQDMVRIFVSAQTAP